MNHNKIKTLLQIICNNKEFIAIMLLFVFFRGIILFFYSGILGGNETYGINYLIHNIGSHEFYAVFRDIDYIRFYHKFGTLLQIPLTLPFYYLWPSNEWSTFVGVAFTSAILLAITYYFLKMYFNRKMAVFFSVLFIFSPIGFTISTISSDTSYGVSSISLLGFIIFLMVSFYYKNKNLRNILLFTLPFLSLYYLALIPSFIIYNFWVNSKERDIKKNLIIISILFCFFMFFVQTFYPLLKEIFSISNGTSRSEVYFNYFKQVFIAENVLNFDNYKIFTYTSLVIFLLLLLLSVYFTIKEAIGQKKLELPLFLAILIIVFFIGDFICNYKFQFYIMRTLTIRTEKILFCLYIAMLLISYYAYKTYFIRMLFSILILLNIMINLLSVDFHNNNYLNYNLYSRNVRYTPYDGKVFDHINVDLSDYPDDIIKLFPVILSPMNGVRFAIKEVNEKKYMIAPQHFFDNIKFFTQEEKKHIFPIYSTKISKKNSNRFYSARIYSASVILNSLFFGYNSRENDPITIRKNPLLDFVVYGFGMRNFFNNTDGINLIRLYSDENIIKSCKKGYHMSYEQFRQYILNVYQLKICENID